jgi:UDPglucose 6-dehydrogenase
MLIFLGLSHLSLCYAAAASLKGFKVGIIDFKNDIENFYARKFNVFEPKLESVIKSKKILISSDFKIINKANVIFLSKDLQTSRANKVNYSEINNLYNKIKPFKSKKVLVVMSQVQVGYTRKLKWNNLLKFHYVETLIFGQAIERAMNPERIIIGKCNHDLKIHKNLLTFLNKFKAPIIEMNYEESELTKGFINTYLASQITTTNHLAELAKLYKADWKKIKSALILDRRIGKYGYLQPGLGISGGNIERDLKTIIEKSKLNKINNSFIYSIFESSDYFKNWIFRTVSKFNNAKFTIGIIGFTYKENTLSVKNSPQTKFLNNIKNKVLIFDDKLKKYNKNLNFLLDKSDILIIFHQLEYLKYINFNKYKNLKYIIDPYKVLNDNNINLKKIKYFTLI